MPPMRVSISTLTIAVVFGTASAWAQAFDVSPDGRRFLMLRVGSSFGAIPVSLVRVQNFLADLKQESR